MKPKQILFVFLACAAVACRTQQRAGDDFVSAETIITGEKNAILAATDRVLAESLFTVEKRMMLQEGKLLIVAHPADKPEAVGSILLSVIERGSDDVALKIEVNRSLYATAEASKSVAKETLKKVQVTLNK